MTCDDLFLKPWEKRNFRKYLRGLYPDSQSRVRRWLTGHPRSNETVHTLKIVVESVVALERARREQSMEVVIDVGQLIEDCTNGLMAMEIVYGHLDKMVYWVNDEKSYRKKCTELSKVILHDCLAR
jgi:hypothetical protein